MPCWLTLSNTGAVFSILGFLAALGALLAASSARKAAQEAREAARAQAVAEAVADLTVWSTVLARAAQRSDESLVREVGPALVPLIEATEVRCHALPDTARRQLLNAARRLRNCLSEPSDLDGYVGTQWMTRMRAVTIELQGVLGALKGKALENVEAGPTKEAQ